MGEKNVRLKIRSVDERSTLAIRPKVLLYQMTVESVGWIIGKETAEVAVKPHLK